MSNGMSSKDHTAAKQLSNSNELSANIFIAMQVTHLFFSIGITVELVKRKGNGSKGIKSHHSFNHNMDSKRFKPL